MLSGSQTVFPADTRALPEGARVPMGVGVDPAFAAATPVSSVLPSGSGQASDEVAADPFEPVLDALVARGWHVAEGLFGEAPVAELRLDAARNLQEENFFRAGIGQGAAQTVDRQLRSDLIRWLDPARPTPPQDVFWRFLNGFRERLNRELFLGLRDFEVQYSIYRPGAFYARHLDQFRSDDARILTFILYLNDAWEPADGGQLRLYLDEADSLDVLPVGGTFVTFLSDRFWHEVLPARRERFAISGWLRRFDPLHRQSVTG